MLIHFIFVVELHLTQVKVWEVTKKKKKKKIRNKTIEDFKYVTKRTLPIANYKNKIWTINDKFSIPKKINKNNLSFWF